MPLTAKGNRLRFFLFIVCTVVLLYGLFRPEQPPKLFENSDKLMHLIAFGGFSLAARLAFLRTPGWLLWGGLLLCAPFSEWLQHQLQPTRQFSLFDIYANLIGVVLAALSWWLLSLLYKRWVARSL